MGILLKPAPILGLRLVKWGLSTQLSTIYVDIEYCLYKSMAWIDSALFRRIRTGPGLKLTAPARVRVRPIMASMTFAVRQEACLQKTFLIKQELV